MKKIGLLIIIPILMLVACANQTSHGSVERIDDFLTDLEQSQEFSGAVLVARDGEVLISKGYGMADAENQVPNTSRTRFRLHWVSMQFTAMAIMMLQAEGELDVQHSICQYIPACPDYWQDITIHHVLTHTSGISDWIQPWESEADWPTTALQQVQQLKYEAPYFEPGEKFRYSENGYIILGYIIEKVSGRPYETFLQQRLFGPLGMVNSGCEDSNLAVGYRATGIKAPVPDLLFRYSASGLYSSVEDLYLWDQALYGERLVPQEYLDQMFTGYARAPSLDIENADYGYGWFIGHVLGHRVIAHGGMMSGYTAMILRFPDERVTIIVLRNYEIPMYDGLEIELAKMVFGETAQ